MRTLAVVLSLFALPLSAQISFEPPKPTSLTQVTVHYSGTVWGCSANVGLVRRYDSQISVGLYFTVCPAVEPVDTAIDLGLMSAGVYDIEFGIAPTSIAIGLAGAKLTVTDASAQFMVSPNVAPASGADVTISGLNLCVGGTCAAPLVTFDGRGAQIVELAGPDKLIVRAPAHDPGTVDVVVSYLGEIYTATAAFNYFASTGGSDPAFYEPVLFPVMINGPGAFGSNWTTEVTMRNENDYTLAVLSGIPAHSTWLSHDEAPNGLLLNVARQAAPKLFFGTLIRDLSRQSEALGTEIPVVREKDFFDRQFTLLNVPTDSRYRVALRFYRIDGGVTLHYRIRPLSTDETLVDTFAFLAPASQGSQLTVAFIGDLLTTFPQLAGKGPLRIDIDGTPAQRASWAFVSVTNNTTQNVTVISPQ